MLLAMVIILILLTALIATDTGGRSS